MEWSGDNFERGNHKQDLDILNKGDGPKVMREKGKPNQELGLQGPIENSPRTTIPCTDPHALILTHPPNQNSRGSEFSQEIRAQRWKRRAREKGGSRSSDSTYGEGKKRKSEGKGGKGDEEELGQDANTKKPRIGENMSGTQQTSEAAETNSQSRRAL
ncbi:hypothetical protein U1Q18_012069 [Sarracenia purpurea var. burkii]